jgi:hypothetical protein
VEKEYVDDLGYSWVQEQSDDYRYTDEGGVNWVSKRELEDFESHNKILKLDESEIEFAYFGLHEGFERRGGEGTGGECSKKQ